MFACIAILQLIQKIANLSIHLYSQILFYKGIIFLDNHSNPSFTFRSDFNEHTSMYILGSFRKLFISYFSINDSLVYPLLATLSILFKYTKKLALLSSGSLTTLLNSFILLSDIITHITKFTLTASFILSSDSETSMKKTTPCVPLK